MLILKAIRGSKVIVIKTRRQPDTAGFADPSCVGLHVLACTCMRAMFDLQAREPSMSGGEFKKSQYVKIKSPFKCWSIVRLSFQLKSQVNLSAMFTCFTPLVRIKYHNLGFPVTDRLDQ